MTDAPSISGSCRTLKKVAGNSIGEEDKGVNSLTRVLYVTAMDADWAIIKGAIQRVWESPES